MNFKYIHSKNLYKYYYSEIYEWLFFLNEFSVSFLVPTYFEINLRVWMISIFNVKVSYPNAWFTTWSEKKAIGFYEWRFSKRRKTNGEVLKMVNYEFSVRLYCFFIITFYKPQTHLGRTEAGIKNLTMGCVIFTCYYNIRPWCHLWAELKLKKKVSRYKILSKWLNIEKKHFYKTKKLSSYFHYKTVISNFIKNINEVIS